MAGPFTSPTAYSVPFDGDSPEAIAAGVTSKSVFDAILEVKQDSINNDRYPITASYGGNAGTGRRLEIYPGTDSSEAPFVAPENTKIVAYTFGAVSNSNGVIAIRNITTGVELAAATFSASKRVVATGLSITGISSLDEVEIYVKSGNISKPYCRIWFNTVT